MSDTEQLEQQEQPKSRKHLLLWVLGAVLLLALILELMLLGQTSAFMKKANLLKRKALLEATQLQEPPCGDAGYVVFFSVSSGDSRARVYHARGETVRRAWDACAFKTDAAIAELGLTPKWVKADIVWLAQSADRNSLASALRGTYKCFYRCGLSLDSSFNEAFLEEELNGAYILDYENGGLKQNYLNAYLEDAGRPSIDELPEDFMIFTTRGWFCDENNAVYNLLDDGPSKGRREVLSVNQDYAKWLIDNGTDYLLRQIKPDGSFRYGVFPRFDLEDDTYNIIRHAGTIWALCCRCGTLQDVSIRPQIESTIEYLLSNVRYLEIDGSRAAFVLSDREDEFSLGASALSVLALNEYMRVFDTDEYTELCSALGRGILAMRGEAPGSFVHALYPDGRISKEFSTVYYDGEAIFALCRLYGLTSDPVWLDAACEAMDYCIANDYIQYRDHWMSYSANELTKYVDRPEYYTFGLQNVARNLETITETETAYHVYTELMMAAFELYDRMIERGIDAGSFDIDEMMEAMAFRMHRQLDGFFYPEIAMYMQNPDSIVYSFMVRSDTFRVRIDDVQHNIGGLCLFYQYYDKLAACGYRG